MGYLTAVADEPFVADQTGVETAPIPATSLKISVLHDRHPVIQASFPAHAIANLANLLPNEVKPRVAAEALDLEALCARYVSLGCPPGELFTLKGKVDTVRVWME